MFGWKKIVLLAAASTAFAACGDDTQTNNGRNNGPFNNGENNGENNGTDADVGMDAEPDVPLRLGCSDPEVLPGNPAQRDGISLTRAFKESKTATKTGCSEAFPDSSDTGAIVLEYTPDQRVRLNLVTDPGLYPGNEAMRGPQPMVEVRRGPCTEPDEVVFCSGTRQSNVVLEPGELYFIVINGDIATTGFTMELEALPIACEPGPDTCVDGAINNCINGGAELETYDCFADCLDESTCDGDTCANRAVIDFSGTLNLSGDQEAYADSWSPEGRPNCFHLNPGEDGSAFEGRDMFIELPMATAGQTVEIDATGSDGVWAFFLLDSCDAASCLAAGTYDVIDVTLNRMEWIVPAAGAYTLVLKSLGLNNQPFDIDVTLRN